MPVPLLNVSAQNLALEQELKSAFDRVLRSGQYIFGPDLSALETEIAQRVGVKHALGISSGTDALLLALMALDIKAGDEVLCPSFTFFATAGCVARLGVTPVFVDADPVTFNLDLADAARKITTRSKAIIPVHLFGQCAEMTAIVQLAERHNLFVIEDAAQSFGARYKGAWAGSLGTFGTYSFFPSKNLGGLGDGGMLVCNDDTLAEKAKILRNHGAEPKYYHKYVGGNFRLDTLQAAFLRVKLPSLAGYNLRRKAHAVRYSEAFSGISELILPREQPEREHIWNQYTIRLLSAERRDGLRAHLRDRGIGSEIYYPVPLDRQECFAGKGNGSFGTCPVAHTLSQQVLSLPVFPELTPEEQDEVIRGVRDFLC